MRYFSSHGNEVRNVGLIVFLCFHLSGCFEQERSQKSNYTQPDSSSRQGQTKTDTVSVRTRSSEQSAPPQKQNPPQTAPAVPSPESPKKPEETCFIATYKHKIARGHTNEETCSHHKNLIQLKRPVTKSGSLCIRVNNTPVSYQTVKGNPDEIMISAVAGPQAKITVRYCVGKPLCNEDCKIQKDEFMASIGGDEDDSDGRGQQNLGKWEAGASPGNEDINQKLDPELKRELANIDEENDQTSVYRGWVSDTEVPACLEKMGGRG